MISSYLNLVPLDEAKSYLRIDSSDNTFDAEITLMINAVSRLVERYAQHIIVEQDEIQIAFDPCVFRVYKFPIAQILSPSDNLDYEKVVQPNYTVFYLNKADEELEIKFGYATVQDVPPEIKLAILEGVRTYFYNSELERNVSVLPNSVMEILNPIKRFTI